MPPRELSRACGYLTVLVPPALLATGVGLQMPALAFIVLIVIAPFLRAVFGEAPERQPEWTESVAKLLHALPLAYASAFLAVLAYTLWALRVSAWTAADYVWLGLSLWAVCIFASCVGHELVHRRSRTERVLGRILCGALGYPLLEHEHPIHHASPGNVAGAEWPALGESLWRFTVRRTLRVFRTAWEGNLAAAQRRGRRWAGGLATAAGSTAATAAAFYAAAGGPGLVMYMIVAIAALWAIQAVTYIQHWGLGNDVTGGKETTGHGWEDLCQLQAWLTLNISFHQAHHRRGHVPYYRLEPEPGAPRAPAGYVVLFFASMVPPLWRAVMTAAHTRWLAADRRGEPARRRLLCVTRSE